jgi:CubicO group peptidase (beta-lactamase class C family)
MAGSIASGSPADYFPDSGAMSGAADLHSTLNDMTRFLIANMQPGPTPLSGPIALAQGLRAAGRNPGTGVGLGWEIDQLGTTGARVYKGGGTRGFTSYTSFMRDGSSGFVLLTNGMYIDTIAPHMLNILGNN